MALICCILLMARLRSREENREISAKEKFVSIFLKPIDPPRWLNLKEIWQKKGNMSSDNTIISISYLLIMANFTELNDL